MSNFKKLRIRAYLQSGVISDQFLPLDGIIRSVVIREAHGFPEHSVSGASTVQKGSKLVDVPFATIGKNTEHYKMWYYACSFAQWPENLASGDSFYVKTNRIKYEHLIDFKGKREKIETARGRYKPLHVQLKYRHALHIDWYAIGDKDRIENYLRFISNLGAKHSQGWGAVLRWEVIEWEHDWHAIGPEGQVMRAIPRLDGKGYRYGVRPSYWNPKHHVLCDLPGMEIIEPAKQIQ